MNPPFPTALVFGPVGEPGDFLGIILSQATVLFTVFCDLVSK